MHLEAVWPRDGIVKLCRLLLNGTFEDVVIIASWILAELRLVPNIFDMPLAQELIRVDFVDLILIRALRRGILSRKQVGRANWDNVIKL